MKEKNWFEQNNWVWDKRDHMWKKQVSGEKTVIPEASGSFSESNRGSIPYPTEQGGQPTDSKPFTKQYNILIFDNCQYPLKIHEVMWKT